MVVASNFTPELANDTAYPYTLAEFQRDASRCMASTKVPGERRGPLLALAIGGVAGIGDLLAVVAVFFWCRHLHDKWRTVSVLRPSFLVM